MTEPCSGQKRLKRRKQLDSLVKDGQGKNLSNHLTTLTRYKTHDSPVEYFLMLSRLVKTPTRYNLFIIPCHNDDTGVLLFVCCLFTA